MVRVSVRNLGGTNATEREVPMSGQQQDAVDQHMLIMVESAQRAGHSESEIVEIVDEALEADAELDRAA
jgi:hypothetical protein